MTALELPAESDKNALRASKYIIKISAAWWVGRSNLYLSCTASAEPLNRRQRCNVTVITCIYCLYVSCVCFKVVFELLRKREKKATVSFKVR